jgi:hypothetical protein
MKLRLHIETEKQSPHDKRAPVLWIAVTLLSLVGSLLLLVVESR